MTTTPPEPAPGRCGPRRPRPAPDRPGRDDRARPPAHRRHRPRARLLRRRARLRRRLRGARRARLGHHRRHPVRVRRAAITTTSASTPGSRRRPAAARRRRRPAPRGDPLPDPRRPGRRPAAPAGGRLAAAPAHRPRHARGDLHLRPRRQRPRAVLGSPVRAVAARRAGPHRRDRPRSRPRRRCWPGSPCAMLERPPSETVVRRGGRSGTSLPRRGRGRRSRSSTTTGVCSPSRPPSTRPARRAGAWARGPGGRILRRVQFLTADDRVELCRAARRWASARPGPSWRRRRLRPRVGGAGRASLSPAAREAGADAALELPAPGTGDAIAPTTAPSPSGGRPCGCSGYPYPLRSEHGDPRRIASSSPSCPARASRSEDPRPKPTGSWPSSPSIAARWVGSSALRSPRGPLGATGALLALANTDAELCIAAFAGDHEAQRALVPGHRLETLKEGLPGWAQAPTGAHRRHLHRGAPGPARPPLTQALLEGSHMLMPLSVA